MVDVKQVLESDAPSSLIDQLGDALLELNAHNDTSEDQVQWEEIEEHFRNLETTLRKNFEELEAKEKKFTKQEVETYASLAEREAAQAKAIVDEWKPKLANAGIDAANGISLETEAFLQLLATFRIASEFDKDEICKFVLAVAHRRQTPELCRFLGLTHKIPGLVESMVSGGKQIDAVRFIHVFQLTESYPLVPLLKTYLKDLRRNSQVDNTGDGTGAHDDVNAKELAALKAVIKCVQEFKFEADYPLDPL
ncbi:hypothetical protein FF2_025088 [Malus domestica]